MVGGDGNCTMVVHAGGGGGGGAGGNSPTTPGGGGAGGVGVRLPADFRDPRQAPSDVTNALPYLEVVV